MEQAEKMNEYERSKELQNFDNTRLGVKGLVDSGITRIPRIFHHPPETLFDHLETKKPNNPNDNPVIPVIDFSGNRMELVKELRDASAKFGFFQVVNHGVKVELLDKVLGAVKGFHEQEPNEKIGYYRRTMTVAGGGVGFYSNYDLFNSRAASWMDTLAIRLAPIPVDPNHIPQVCSELIEWDKEMKQLGEKLMGLLCEGLGLSTDKLTGNSYLGRRTMGGQYYPYCPEPDKTVGIATHTDPGILTILLQDQSGGLQVKYEHNWIDLKPVHGALVVNIGDLFQILSNDEYKSGEHRVYANPNHKPRVSIATFLSPGEYDKVYGPLPELVSPERPAIYKQLVFSDFMQYFLSKELKEKSMISQFRL